MWKVPDIIWNSNYRQRLFYCLTVEWASYFLIHSGWIVINVFIFQGFRDQSSFPGRKGWNGRLYNNKQTASLTNRERNLNLDVI